jgi:hypothetical protein
LNSLLTFDYELFFGVQTGTPEKCMVEPTMRLMDIAQKHQVAFNFFVDVGYLYALLQYAPRYPVLQKQYDLIVSQLSVVSKLGHDLQLHIHPHWEDCYYDGRQWVMHTQRYRLDQFSKVDITSIVEKYFHLLQSLSLNTIQTFRAGGWCVPDWSLISDVFKKVGITYDSTVFAGGKLLEGVIQYDFENAPTKSIYAFKDNVCVEDLQGTFIEIPITSDNVSPLFFWKLYAYGKWDKPLHQSIGDGVPIAQQSARNRNISQTTVQAVSTDGYFASLLKKQFDRNLQQQKPYFVTIGHPKACSQYSFKALDSFLSYAKDKTNFITYSSLSLQ